MGLTGASPAAAQMLTLGDAGGPGFATISGSGTMATGDYTFAGGAGPGTSSYNDVELNDPSILTLKTGGSITTLNTFGGTANILGGGITTINAGDGTNINVLGGTVDGLYSNSAGPIDISGGTVSTVSANGFYAGGDINVSGGNVTNLSALRESNARITGGTVQNAYAEESGSLYISGGKVNFAEATTGSKTFSISGGTVQTVQVDLGAGAGISGGTIQTLQVIGSVTISGGTIQTLEGNSDPAFGETDITGGKFHFINNTSLLDIFGTNLTATQISGTGDFNALLTGTLQNGDSLRALYQGSGGSDLLEFNGQPAVLSAPVPEVSSVVSFGLMLCLGGSGLVFTRRKKMDKRDGAAID